VFKTLAARLTFLYLLLFSVLSLLVFVIISYSLEENLLSRIDGYLVEETGEFATILEQGGLEAVRHEIRLETESRGVDQVFIRIYSDRRQTVAVSDLRSWINFPELNDLLTSSGEQPEFLTVDPPGQRGKVRLFHHPIGQGYTFQAGMLLTQDQLLIDRLRRSFVIGFVSSLIMGTLIGLYVSRKALTGVSKVRERTDQISQGDLSHEIHFHDQTEEVNHLISSVNHMQRQMRKLIGELQDVTNNIAHDLRSPVTRMRGLAETALIGESSPEDFRNMAGAVVEECDGLVGMINTMLDIAETDAGIKRLDLKQVDVGLMLQDVVDLFSTMAEDNQVGMRLSLAPDPLIVWADRSRLQRALANVVDNAIKFTPPGGTIRVEAAVAGAMVEIRIADTGIGIAKADLAKVCDRFYRGDHSRTTPGSGLGLSLVQAIIRSHGGELQIESEEGCGTKVIIRLPAA